MNKQSFTDKKKKDTRYFGDIATARLLKKNAACPSIRIVIPKAVVPKAVKRNRIKRIFREAFRAIVSTGISLAVYPKKSAEGGKMKDARELLKKAIRFFDERAG